jgi:hypothetical protein
MGWLKEFHFKWDLIDASIRLLTGLKGKDFMGCVWYEGIKEDSEKELEAILTRELK